jgi:hypothetical protein
MDQSEGKEKKTHFQQDTQERNFMLPIPTAVVWYTYFQVKIMIRRILEKKKATKERTETLDEKSRIADYADQAAVIRTMVTFHLFVWCRW